MSYAHILGTMYEYSSCMTFSLSCMINVDHSLYHDPYSPAVQVLHPTWLLTKVSYSLQATITFPSSCAELSTFDHNWWRRWSRCLRRSDWLTDHLWPIAYRLWSMIYDTWSVMYDRNHKGHATARWALYLKHWRKYKIVMREILMIESKQIQSDQCDIPAQKQRQ